MHFAFNAVYHITVSASVRQMGVKPGLRANKREDGSRHPTPRPDSCGTALRINIIPIAIYFIMASLRN
jgi:hypothetical protein